MKIKEIEQKTGIKCANIRYYEKEGLFIPSRNKGNNYRDYSEADAEALEKIKVLRLIGLSIEEIRKINSGELLLEDAVKERLDKLKEEENAVKEMQDVCHTILDMHIEFESLSAGVLDHNHRVWQEQLKKIWKKDVDHSLLLKGFFSMIPLPLLRFLAAYMQYGKDYLTCSWSNYTYQQNMVLLYAGIFFIGYGLLWAFIEGHTDKPLFWVHRCGSSWAAPGLGAATNSFTLCSVGLFLIISRIAMGKFICLFLATELACIIIRGAFMIVHANRKRDCESFSVNK